MKSNKVLSGHLSILVTKWKKISNASAAGKKTVLDVALRSACHTELDYACLPLILLKKNKKNDCSMPHMSWSLNQFKTSDIQHQAKT